MNKDKHIGQAIRFVRISQGLGQEELAQKAGISGSFISQLESGVRDPSWDVLMKLCESLRVPLTLLAMILESENSFVRPIVSLAYNELSKVSREKEGNHA